MKDYYKKIDKSFFEYGITIPNDLIESFIFSEPVQLGTNHIYETGDILETNFLSDFGKSISNKQANRVKFKEGIYGGNIFEFQIPKAYLKGFNNDINVRFGYDNHNAWHVVNKYYIDVDVNQISKDKAKVTLYQKNIHRTDGNIIDTFENTKTAEVTPVNNNISIYMGP